jgi:hypothetical protein
MKPEKAVKRLKIKLPEKCPDGITSAVYDLWLANPPKISDEQFSRYMDMTGITWYELFKDFGCFAADFTGLSYLAEWVKEKAVPYASNLFAKKNRSNFL